MKGRAAAGRGRLLPGLAAFTTVLGVVACGGERPTSPGTGGSADVAAVEVTTSDGAVRDTLTALEATVHLEATARDAAGDPIPGASIEWTSSDQAVATVDDEGTATAVGNGLADVTATAGEASGSLSLAVEQSVATVTVSPTSAMLTAIGDTQRFAVDAADANDHPVEGVGILWQTSDPAVAVVDTAGLVEARAPGEATITAAAQGVPGHADLTVAPEGTRLVFDLQPPDGSLDEPIGPVRVAVEDALGNRIAVNGLTVDLELRTNPSGAALSGGASATTSGGVAEYTGLAVDGWGRGYTLEASAAGLDTAVSAPFDVELVFAQVDAGRSITCGVTPNAELLCWGDSRAVGAGPVTPFGSPLPVPIRVSAPASGPVAWKLVAAGNAFACGVTAGGDAFCWGDNGNGQLGTGTTGPEPVPEPEPVVGLP